MLSDISSPTCVVVGDEDVMTPVKYSQRLANAIPNAALQTIENAGHMLPVEKPEEVACILTDFLNQCESTA